MERIPRAFLILCADILNIDVTSIEHVIPHLNGTGHIVAFEPRWLGLSTELKPLHYMQRIEVDDHPELMDAWMISTQKLMESRGTVMPILDMKMQQLDLGILQHKDGGSFKNSACFYETTPEHDYWIAVIDGKHSVWGHMRFQATIPKKIAATAELAVVLITGAIAEQVRILLKAADVNGRPLDVVFSNDGWVLV
jgi:hypothetical protein